MSLIGVLEFKTIIDDKPVTIKIPNAHIHNIDVLVEDGYKEFTCVVTAIRDIEEEHQLLFLHFIKIFVIIYIDK